MGSITGSLGSNGTMTYLNTTRYLNCSCPAGFYPTQITFNDIKSGGAYWKNNSGSKKILDIHLVNSAGTLLVANLMRITLNANGTDSSTKTTKTFDASGYSGQGIYIIGGNATGNIYLQNGTSVTVTTAALSYTLTTQVSPSGYGSVTAGGTIACGSTKSLTASPSTGRYFSSWSKTAGSLSSTTSNPTTFTMGAGNATVTANFGTSSYTLTTAVSPSGTGSVTAGGSISYGGTKSLTATAGTGYQFSSWSKTAGSLSSTTSNPTTFTMGAGNATVTANFSKRSYTLTTAASPAAGGSVTAGGSMQYQATKSLTATASTGYSFSSWSKTAGSLSSTTSNPTTFTMGAGNATVTASFTKNSYTLTTAASPAGGGTVTAGGSIQYQGTKELTATPETGYEFTSWSTTSGSLSSTTTNPTTFTMGAGNATVTATFTKINYTVTTAADPVEGGTLVSDVATATYGDTVTLTATPTVGYEFVDYTTDPEVTIENDQFSMPASNLSITANFVLAAAPSIPSLSKKTFEGGETITMSIDSVSSSLVHKYRLRFNDDMDTGWVSVAAGVTSVDLYIPIAWAMKTEGALIVTNGTLSLETYLDEALIGTETITSLRYKVLDDTFPKFVVWRCDQSGNKTATGLYGKYSFVVPDGADSYSITYDEDTVTSPETTGDILPNDKQEFTLDSNHIVTLSLTYGSETFTLSRDIPKVVSITKAF